MNKIKYKNTIYHPFKGENISPHQQKIIMIIKKKIKNFAGGNNCDINDGKINNSESISNLINHFLNFTIIV